MKNYYTILGVPENASMQEIAAIGRRKVQDYSVDHIFGGKRLGIDYTEEDWKTANQRYADVIEAFQILRDEKKRLEYNQRLRDYRRNLYTQQKANTQNVNSAQSNYYQRGYEQTKQTTGQSTEHRRRTTQNAQREQTRQSAQRDQNTSRRGRYEKTNADNTMERGPRRTRKSKSGFGKMIDSFKEVRQDEKEYPFYERHQNLNKNIRKELHRNVKSVPGEIVYQMANGTLHVTYEFIHQLKKLSFINEDSVPKYVFRNRKLAAAALAVALMTTMPNGGEDIQPFPTPETTITQETTTETEVNETVDIVYEEPTIQMTQYYEVVKGDTLSRISTETGVMVYEIQDMNNRIGSDKIYIGETLILPRTIDREDLHYFTITIPAKGMSCAELAKEYRTDEETIIRLNKEAVAYINTGYIILTDTAVVPNFITVEELDVMKETASRHNY